MHQAFISDLYFQKMANYDYETISSAVHQSSVDNSYAIFATEKP